MPVRKVAKAALTPGEEVCDSWRNHHYTNYARRAGPVKVNE